MPESAALADTFRALADALRALADELAARVPDEVLALSAEASREYVAGYRDGFTACANGPSAPTTGLGFAGE